MNVRFQAALSYLLSVSLAGASWGSTSTVGQEPAPQRRPNIVLILADDLGYGDLRCYQPQSKIPTPNLDHLASQGVRGLDSHSPSAVCSPTRYGLLTGRYAWRTWLKASVLLEWDPPLIEANRLTLPSLLREHGYHTACIGKWHLGWDWPITKGSSPNRGGGRGPNSVTVDFSQPILGGPTTRGFDHYFGHDVPNFPPYCFIEDDRVLAEPTEMKPDSIFGVEGLMSPGWRAEAELPELTRRAVAYIEGRAAADPPQPFFLYFPLPAPHTPIAPAKEFVGKSEAGIYGDFVHQIDYTVGRIMQAVEAAGLTDETLFVFTSDNGSPARNGEGMCGHLNSVTAEFGHVPNAPWRGIKADIHEGGHRVPFIVRWPGRIPEGSTTSEVTCHTDFFATIAGVLGVALPHDAAEDSFDILPALLGEELQAPIREATMHHSIEGMYALRRGNWKLIFGRGTGGWTQPSFVQPREGEPPGQLYDLSQDAKEANNVFLDHPERVEELLELAESYVTSGRSTPGRDHPAAESGERASEESTQEDSGEDDPVGDLDAPGAGE